MSEKKENCNGCVPVLTDAQAKHEASRCLMCDDSPCVAACPASVPVKHFIRAIRFDNPRRAINLIREQNVMAGVCGLACPVEKLCVGACRSTDLTVPVAIDKLQHYAAEKELASGRKGKKGEGDGEKVAIIGGGPSGLSVAAELARLGHNPTIFERSKRAGGICSYGVPAHRVPQKLVAGEVAWVESLGVEIKTGQVFGQGDLASVDKLFDAGFKAVYVSAGLQEGFMPGIKGEDLDGVRNWKEFLNAFSAYNLGEGSKPEITKSVVIVGGGSVAMDVASAAHALGAKEIDIVCLEAPNEMPADEKELKDVWELGARFHTRTMPLEVTGEGGKVLGLAGVRIRWKEPEKFIPSNAEKIEGTEYWLPGETVIFAIGAKPSEMEKSLPGVKLTGGGKILVDEETQATSRAGVYAGGDVAADGGATIVKAVAEGKRAGQAIDAYLRG